VVALVAEGLGSDLGGELCSNREQQLAGRLGGSCGERVVGCRSVEITGRSGHGSHVYQVALLRSGGDPVTWIAVPVTYELSHLRALEAEAIHIIREVAAEFERPVLLFSGGKDSIVMLHLATKAFWPGRVPFPVMHIDTGHNFDEVLEFRDGMVERVGARLVVASVQDDIDAGRSTEETGPRASRNRLQTVTLLRAIEENRFDAVFGGARRDEEKARAKERVFSFRDEFGQWDPKNQRPELWSLYNGRHRKGEHIRVFPLSNWTELDIWQYIADEEIELPPIYFAHKRMVFQRDGMWLADTPFVTRQDGEELEERVVRFRTVGDASCTGAVESPASTLEQVIAEVAATRITERGATRADDRISEAGMEDRKKEGYF
jgi:sulfate adenylyltransferase subunit 2